MVTIVSSYGMLSFFFYEYLGKVYKLFLIESKVPGTNKQKVSNTSL